MIGCLDIGGTKIAAGIIDRHGRLLAERQAPTQPEAGPQDAVRRMTAMLRACENEVLNTPQASSSLDTGSVLEAVGIGCTGPVYPQTGTIGDVEFLRSWQGFGLSQALSAELSIPVVLENDADAAAMAEWQWGSGQGSRSFILVTVGTGIGAGIILAGQLYHGVDGSHPEIGHMLIDPSGPPCYYGGRGCWEEMASGPALEAWAQTQHPQNIRLSALDLCSLARAGDPFGRAAVAREAGYLGLGLANLIMLFTPEIISLGGGLMRQSDLFLGGIQQQISELCGSVPYEKVRIVPAQMGASAGLVGAGAVALQRLTAGLNDQS